MNKKYDDMDFVWINSHWDVHLSGLCRENGKLCRFETDHDTIYQDDDENITCQIYSLSFKEKIIWLLRKKMFELSVGKHFTYPFREQGYHYCVRGSKWIHNLLIKFHYKIWNKIDKKLG